MLKQAVSQSRSAAHSSQQTYQTTERIERLAPGEQVLRDIYTVMGGPGGFTALDIDMTAAQTWIHAIRAEGLHVTFTHLIVWAAARAIAQHPAMHILGAGPWSEHPDHVDLSIAVATGRFHPAMMLIKQAEQKTLHEIAAEIIQRTPIVRAQADQELKQLHRLGRWIPLKILRRWLIARFQNQLAFRRTHGIMTISSVPYVNFFVPFTTVSTAALGVGHVREATTVINGQSVVRPLVTITCCFDHKVWHGGNPALLLHTMRLVLEAPHELNSFEL